MDLTYRKAEIDDLPVILNLLVQDEMAKLRENPGDQRYVDAFVKIAKDPNQFLMAVELDGQIVASCHLTIIPSLTFIGSTRMQIEAVRVANHVRGQKIGQWMIEAAIEYGKAQGAVIFQLTTNKQRVDAYRFYEKLGFQGTHDGMKLYLDREAKQ